MDDNGYIKFLKNRTRELTDLINQHYSTQSKQRILVFKEIEQDPDNHAQCLKRLDRLKNTFQEQITNYKEKMFSLLGFQLDLLPNGDVLVKISGLEWRFCIQEGNVVCPEGYDDTNQFTRDGGICFPAYFGRIQVTEFDRW